MTYVVVALMSAAWSAVLTPAVRRIARRVGAMDQPATRKIHVVSVPRLGGIGSIT